MKKILFLYFVCWSTIMAYGQCITPVDSIFIFKNIVSYENGKYYADEIFLDEYWATNNSEAKKYYYLATYCNRIIPASRVLMLSYLDKGKQFNGLSWIQANLETKQDTISFFVAINLSEKRTYSELGINRETVKIYLPEAKYK